MGNLYPFRCVPPSAAGEYRGHVPAVHVPSPIRMKEESGDNRPMNRPEKWLLAEGELAGKPLLIRAREMEPLPVLPHLLVVDLFYDSVDDTNLPGEDDYEIGRAHV